MYNVSFIYHNGHRTKFAQVLHFQTVYANWAYTMIKTFHNGPNLPRVQSSQLRIF